MKYVIYIDYNASYRPMYSEYRPLEARNIKEAIIEADAMHDINTMYLIRIMERAGKAEKVEKGVKAQTYTAILEKRSTKWTDMDVEHMDGKHSIKYFYAKFGDWYEIL